MHGHDGVAVLRLVLGSKWSLEILHALGDGPKRRMEIWSAIRRTSVSRSSDLYTTGAHSDPLDRALDRLVTAGLVARAEDPGVFPRRVVYAITPEAGELVGLLAPISSSVEAFVVARERISRRSDRCSA